MSLVYYLIIRLHNSDRTGIEKLSGKNWNKVYINREEELKNIIEMIKDLNNQVWMFTQMLIIIKRGALR